MEHDVEHNSVCPFEFIRAEGDPPTAGFNGFRVPPDQVRGKRLTRPRNSPATGIAGSLNEASQWGAQGLPVPQCSLLVIPGKSATAEASGIHTKLKRPVDSGFR